MANAKNRLLNHVRTALATKDRMPTVEEVEAFLAKGPRLSAETQSKLVADYKKGSTTIERLARLEMKHLPRIMKGNRAI